MSTGVVPPVGCIGPARLTAGFEDFGRLDLYAHLEVHGDLRPLSADDLIDLARRSNSPAAVGRASRSTAR